MNNIQMTPDEYARLKNGGTNSWKDWGRLLVAVAIPLITAVMWFSHTAFQTTQNSKDISTHQEWIKEHAAATEGLRAAINAVDVGQRVLLEKITGIEQDVQDLKKEK